MATAALVTGARQSFGKVISVTSTRRYIKRCGYAFYKVRRKPFLTSSNKCRCVAWAKSHLSWTPSQWEKATRGPFWINFVILKNGQLQRTIPESAPFTPSFSVTPAHRGLTQTVRFNVYQDYTYGGTSVNSGFEPGSSRPQCPAVRVLT
ncbi:hypothetical protein AVEN_99171-1 [Araneus ventricosus]|uniref:Transposase Tc1-like domain-containing protein n=1 Tax=Araneus ventricosus TaxID=182803 RepID=A0A4Y2CJ65_ARAVE|nr:hypothetical protein AVEN_99171-1 [Araneus ventricosus]